MTLQYIRKFASAWKRVPWLLALLLATLAAPGAPARVFSSELATASYDCSLTVQPPAADTSLQIRLEQQNDASVVVTFTRTQVDIAGSHDGKTTAYGAAAYPPAARFPARATILRRGERLAILLDDAQLLQASVPRGPGAAGVVSVEPGWGDPAITVQRLEPVVFADNFMRTADEAGAWTVRSGHWSLLSAWDRDPKGNARRFDNASFALNPFAWVGQAGTEPAFCAAGQPFWEDYTLSVAVRPAADGAVGVAVNLADARTGWLVRWTPANAGGEEGNCLALCRLERGRLVPVARDPGGYLPGQWYRLSVVSTPDSLRVLVDQRERLSVSAPRPWRGGIGLYAEGQAGATFDDVTAYGRTLAKELIAENVLARVNDRFLTDDKGMREWASSAIDWTAFPADRQTSLSRWEYAGDQWLLLVLRRGIAERGEAALALGNDGADPLSGYRAVIDVPPTAGKTVYTLYRNDVVLATRAGDPLEAGVDYTYRFWRIGNRLKMEKDGNTVLDIADNRPLPGLRAACRVTGSLQSVHGPLVLARNLLDETFSEAPVDWIGQGAWMATTRWSCSSQWSFLAGWDRGDAVLWHKQRFTGDQTFQAFVAPKMEYPREHQFYEYRFRDMAITICGDGRDPRSGYAGIFGAPDDAGRPNARSVLLRNGKVVGSAPVVMPDWLRGHIEWFDLVLSRHGAVVDFWIGGQKVISFTDPEPIAGGIPAIWTTDNGMAIARTRLFYAAAPQPRTDPQVIIDSPWLPEWANVGQPLALDFPETASTTGRPVRLQAEICQAPPGEGQAMAIEGKRAILTPAVPGDHWYRITATDGAAQSPPVQLAMPVFRPALGRDDSHALVLYWFTEGGGTVVRDRSPRAPAADLAITGKAPVVWYPGQGLHLAGPNRLSTTGGVEKLMEIARTKSATLECWISPDTVFPMTDWLGIILSWELPGDGGDERRNFGLANIAYYWTFSPWGTLFGTRYGGRSLTVQGAHNGLQHLAVTWDGQTTRLYVNGVLQGAQWGSWQPQNWFANATLLLGNGPEGPQRPYLQQTQELTGARDDIITRNANGQHVFLGTYYLVAIHDRCFDQAQVERHFRAGPSAR